MSLRGRRALITGASQGIGKACAFVFAEKGAELVLVDKNKKALKEVSEELKSKGFSVFSYAFDLMRTNKLESLISQAKKEKPIDILVNNAGFDRPGTLAKTEKKMFVEVLTIHVVVPFLLMKLLLPDMRMRKWGRIINISSVYGLEGAKGEVAYSTAKAAIIGLTKSVAKEGGPDGVTVNAIVPGIIRTPPILKMPDKYKEPLISRTAIGRMGEPEEVAYVASFLASDEASYITGTTLVVSGGWGG
ncbi:MAG: SDR family oxidoreductase [Desulfobacterota bacterium]|nr:SDR family oxidoreductase [Thermodesulfobacteriota bacterium]MDW8001222.1 SDR family NAD(P)-dependent oxidoreductase [Deltaproteobacteria bacterium]